MQFIIRFRLLGLVCLAFCTFLAKAEIIYVVENASGNGTSWSDATGDLRQALLDANSGDEVWVTIGTFKPTTCSPCTTADRAISFEIPPGVKLIGSFEGTESTPAERAIPELTVLSGRIDVTNPMSDSYTVLSALAPTPGTYIESFELKFGRADNDQNGAKSSGASGGLLYVTTYTEEVPIELALVDINFDSSYASHYGGAVYIDGSSHRTSALTFESCSFLENQAGVAGGALVLNADTGGKDNSTFRLCSFEGNYSGDEGGGAILLSGARGGIIETAFEILILSFNETTGAGGGLKLDAQEGDCRPSFHRATVSGNYAEFGGGISINGGYEGNASPIFANSFFSQNESTNAGGGVFVSAVFGGNADFEFHDSRFYGNETQESGGGILINAIEGSSRGLYKNCTFRENVANLYGGAIYNLGKSGVCSPTLINCLIADNEGSSAGGMYCLGSDGGESSPLILNCTFANNQAEVGGGLYSNGNDQTGTAEPLVVNSIFYGNQADFGATFRTIHATPQVVNCAFDVSDCNDLISGAGGAVSCSSNNLFSLEDPFREVLQNDYALRENAAVIDFGIDSFLFNRDIILDLEDGARFRGDHVDLGAFELSSDPLMWTISNIPDTTFNCQGNQLLIQPTIQPNYPADFRWSINNQTVAESAVLNLESTVGTNSYQLVATSFGESLTQNAVAITAPTITTSLQASMLNPDTICAGELSTFRVNINAGDSPYTIQWTNQNGEIVSTTTEVNVTPSLGESIELRVDVSFVENCVDLPHRDLVIKPILKNCLSSITQNTSDQQITLSPVPAQDQLKVEIPSSNTPQTYTILSATGTVVRSGMIREDSRIVNLSDVPPGMYVFVLKENETYYRKSFVKL